MAGQRREVKVQVRVRTWVVAILGVGMAASSTLASSGAPSAAAVPGEGPSTRAATLPPRAPTLAADRRQVVEGERVTLTASIGAARSAQKITLQERYVPSYGSPSWQPVRSVRVNNRSKVAFTVVATNENVERFRVLVRYSNRGPGVASRPVTVVVWRWIPLRGYHPYYESQAFAAGFGTVAINGIAYAGWGAATTSHAGSWESRFTPGRHCTAFRAVLGISDISGDGSTGSISFTADDRTVYTSPVLTPGMSVPVTVELARPYRFGIQLFDTTPGGTSGRDAVEAWPVLGEPAFRCTGV